MFNLPAHPRKGGKRATKAGAGFEPFFPYLMQRQILLSRSKRANVWSTFLITVEWNYMETLAGRGRQFYSCNPEWQKAVNTVHALVCLPTMKSFLITCIVFITCYDKGPSSSLLKDDSTRAIERHRPYHIGTGNGLELYAPPFCTNLYALSKSSLHENNPIKLSLIYVAHLSARTQSKNRQ